MKFDANLMSFVEKDLKKGKVPMLLGEPGIGKSSWCEALAIRMQTKCFTLAVNQLADKADLTGARLIPIDDTMTKYKQVFYPHEIIMDAVEYAEKNPRETPILFLDELNRTTSDVTSAALSIPTMRRIGSVKLPVNLKVMIAGNDKGNITSLDEASISRFVLYRVEPDAMTFLDIMDSTLNQFVKSVIQQYPQYIFCKSLDTITAGKKNADDNDEDETLSIDDIISDGEGMAQISTPRTIHAVSDWLNEFDSAEILAMSTIPAFVDGIQTTLFMEGLVGHCGYTNFTVALCDEIMKNINAISANAVSRGPRKPKCYNSLKAAPDIVTLDDIITNLNDAEKSSSIVYAICEKVDNTIVLNALVKQSAKLANEDMKILLEQISSENYDVENFNTVTNSGTTIGNALEMFSSN